jgi:hypothetical protein
MEFHFEKILDLDWLAITLKRVRPGITEFVKHRTNIYSGNTLREYTTESGVSVSVNNKDHKK